MSNPKVAENYVETLQAVNYSNGVVRMFMLGQNLEHMANGFDPEEQKPELRQVVTMPLAGFLYGCSVIEKFLKDEKMQEIIEKHRQAGFLPSDASTTQDTQEAAE